MLMVRRRSPEKATRDSSAAASRRWLVVVLLLVLAVSCRLLFWQATDDRTWPYSVWYKGDAATWLDYATAIQHDAPFELGIPLRPPGMAYLIAALWNGEQTGISSLRLIWCVFGAFAVVLFYLAARRPFGEPVALAVGILSAGSTGLMMLSTSLNNETPYLVLVAATLWQWERLQKQPTTWGLVLFSALNGLACLVRVEHALYFGLTLLALVVLWRRQRGGPSASWRLLTSRVAVMAAAAVMVLAPWHVKAFSAIQRFNTIQPPAEETAAVEASLPPMTWQEGAERQRELLPAFCRKPASLFVAATVAVRGRQVITEHDFAILEEAFGYRPEPVSPLSFVALYGGLNFSLANNPHADGGFSLAALDEPPPLAGGPRTYPLALVTGLPPRDLTLTYPPHLRLFNDGYALGWQWIRHNPADALRLMARKLSHFWSGAAMGLTGRNLPLGVEGVRRRVDLATPSVGALVIVWQLAVLALCVLGIVVSWRSAAVLPWTLFLAAKVAITLPFFGYARHGATVIPVVLLLCCLAVQWLAARLRPSRVEGLVRRWRKPALVAIAMVLLLVELGRWIWAPTVLLDGRNVGATDPFPVTEHENRTVLTQPHHD